jgi:hypothetical protein
MSGTKKDTPCADGGSAWPADRAPPAGISEGLFLLRDPNWRDKVYVGGLLLLVPITGWFTALGYRKAIIERLYRGTEPLLPEWRNAMWSHTWEGVKAAAVIYAQFLPLSVLLAAILATRGVRMDPRMAAAAGFFVLFPIFSTLAFPLAVAVATWPDGPAYLHLGEAALFLLGYAAITFIIPAGFLQVSRTGRYTAAFGYHHSLPFLARNFRPYMGAWYRSIVMSLCGHFAVPFSPWGVVWCYLGIIYAFNRVLADELARNNMLAPESWFTRLWDKPVVLVPAGRWSAVVADPVKPTATAVARVGPAFVPLPRAVAGFVMRS